MSFVSEKNQAVVAARELLLRFKVKAGPVDVFSIAKQLGIEVREMELPDDISGLIKRKGKDGQPVMAINESHNKERRRFTAAHEIAHFLLHVLDPLHVDAAQVYFRSKSSVPDVREIQANSFAAELLMPTEFLLEDFKSGVAMDGSSEHLPELAKKYKVSKEAMAIRIGTLLQAE